MKRTICFSRSVKGLVATLASSKDSFAIGEPFIPPLSKARWRLRIWNGLQLTVCDYVRLLTVLLTTRQGVDYGRKESRQMCPSRVQMPGAQGQQVLWSLLPGFSGPPISRLQLRTPGLCWWEIPESVAWPDFVTWIVTQLGEKDGLGELATQLDRGRRNLRISTETIYLLRFASQIGNHNPSPSHHALTIGVQEVPGSNPGGPTKYLKDLRAFNEMGRAQSVPIHSAHCTPP